MNKNGFTLIEIVVSLVVSLVIFCGASISFSALERQKLLHAANVLRSDLRYCQKNAMDEKRKYELTFGRTGNTDYYTMYYIRRADDAGTLKKVAQVSLPLGICLASNSQFVSYTVQGTTGDACTITLRGKKYYLPITVNVGCGRVQVKKLEKMTGK